MDKTGTYTQCPQVYAPISKSEVAAIFITVL